LFQATSSLVVVSSCALTASEAAAQVVVNEIAWMGTHTSANDGWIELFNDSASDVDLTGWTLAATDDTPSISLAWVVPAGGHFLLERTDESAVPTVTADQIYTGAMGNTGEVLELRDGSAVLQDSVDALYAADNTTKETMWRVDPAVIGTESTNWTHSLVDGTPMNSGLCGGGCTMPRTRSTVSPVRRSCFARVSTS
jgi:hypothetical protein